MRDVPAVRVGRAGVGVGSDADSHLSRALPSRLPPAALQSDIASSSNHDPRRMDHLSGHHNAGIRRSEDVSPLPGRPADRSTDDL